MASPSGDRMQTQPQCLSPGQFPAKLYKFLENRRSKRRTMAQVSQIASSNGTLTRPVPPDAGRGAVAEFSLIKVFVPSSDGPFRSKAGLRC